MMHVQKTIKQPLVYGYRGAFPEIEVSGVPKMNTYM
jgi:hypothetical protein